MVYNYCPGLDNVLTLQLGSQLRGVRISTFQIVWTEVRGGRGASKREQLTKREGEIVGEQSSRCFLQWRVNFHTLSEPYSYLLGSVTSAHSSPTNFQCCAPSPQGWRMFCNSGLPCVWELTAGTTSNYAFWWINTPATSSLGLDYSDMHA